MIRTDLSKQQALDGDSEAIQQINFTGNLDRKSKRNHCKLFTRKYECIVNLFGFHI